MSEPRGQPNAAPGSVPSTAPSAAPSATPSAAPRAVPSGPPSVRMRWDRLAFLHWRVDPARVRPLVPAPLELDLFDGSAWVGLVPFAMQHCRFRGLPALGLLTDFWECNVRTYVRHRDQIGVWFMSLDAASWLPVLGGRTLWGLNYRHARFTVQTSGARTDYALRRRRGPGATHIVWETHGPERTAQPGTLEHFLVERYALFTNHRGRVSRSPVWHQPWQLTDARLLKLEDSLLEAQGLPGVAARRPDIVLASPGVDALGWRAR